MMWNQILQIAIALFAGACAVMVIRTVAEVLPELVGAGDPTLRRGEPVPIPVAVPRPERTARYR